MNDVLKQRLVGALILVALGVVFWPIIFVQPGDQPLIEQKRVPPPPAVNTAPVEPPDQFGLRPPEAVLAREQAETAEELEPESPPEVSTVPQTRQASATEPVVQALPEEAAEVTPEPPAEPRTRSEAPESLILDSQGVPVAWILQVASVSSAEKAEQLRQKLLRRDAKAYTKKISRDGKKLYRVYIGPKFERAPLETMRPEIDKEFGVKSLVVRYIP